MSDPRWTDVDRLLDAALDRAPEQRGAFLREACGDDEALRREVESLLAHAKAEDFLDRHAHDVNGRPPTDDTQSSLGHSLGPYRIVGLLGRGGMGEVYRAHDTTLGRDVAIKILPSVFTTDADRRARFDREARVLAALNHPHIGAIYGVHETDGVRALVLELVEGDTLADRVATGALPVQEALSIARQIAEALEAAHEKGVVHRDLKPANVKITPHGMVKVLDFGLAKATADASGPDLTQPPTVTAGSTRDGVILGTAAYMSPEQARGKPLDKRTDIWAFGCVLYEMLAGRSAYNGETLSDTLAAILDREPDWQRLPAKTPGKVRELLRRCLQKDAQHRLRDIGDARFQIEEALTEPAASLTTAAPPPVRRSRERLLWVAGLVAVAAGVAASTRYLTTPIVERDEVRLEVTTPPTSDLTAFAISPNGKMLVFQATSEGKSSLWLRPLDSVTPRLLAGTDGASQPFWSPDSLSVGFTGGDGELKRIDVGSGTVQQLTRRGAGGAWNRDGTILFITGGSNPILEVSATGGEAAPATQITPETTPQFGPQFLPDGRHFLFTAMGTARAVYVGLLGGSELPQRIVDGISGAYGSGHLLFVREGTLFAQPFDPVRLKLEGAPTIVANQLATRNTLGSFALSVSAAGPIAYRAGPTGAQSQFAWYDRSGTPLEALAGSEVASLLNSALSPDGRQLAISRNVGGGQGDIWLLDLDRGLPTRFTVDPAYDLIPVWSPDGRRIAFSSTRLGTASVHVKPAGGTGSEELIWEHGPPSDWSSDGRFILVAREYGPGNPDDIWAVPIDGDRKAFPIVESKAFNESGGQFSPDGRWIAFQSDESGQFEIYVQPFPGPGGKRQISSEGGVQARWRRDGAELFYIASDNRLMAVPVRLDSTGGTVDIGAPVSLFTPNLPMAPTVAHARHYMVSPDGQKLLVHTLKEVTMPITVILNWRPTK